MNDKTYMRRAIELAREGKEARGGAGTGCVIVLDDEIVGEGHNEVGGRHDPTAHAEIVAIRRAGKRLGTHEFRGATLYSTLQPCGMCSMASIWAKLRRIVYGAGRRDVHEMYFEDRHINSIDYIRDAFKDDVTMQGGILAVECAALYVGSDEYVPKAKWVNI